MAGIRLDDGTTIPEQELVVSFSRSGGPGGQHVNTSATKVELRFDVSSSPSLNEGQKRRVRNALAGRLTADGELVIQASRFRSQQRNREDARERLRQLLNAALKPRRPRRPTRVPKSTQRARLESKRRRSERKRLRQRPRW